ncbi:MAG: hypothetical protein ACK4GL_12400 [Flavobacteriales bacterium]
MDKAFDFQALDDDARAFMSNPEPIRLKKAITQHIEQAFYALANEIESKFPNEALKIDAAWSVRTAKISKGENYQDMPYVVLDYPFLMHQKDLLLFRTMFWWGHYFSLNLLIKGESFHHPVQALIQQLQKSPEPDVYILTSDNFWQNDISGLDFSSCNAKAAQYSWEQYRHIRMVHQVDFDSIDSLQVKCLAFTQKMLSAMQLLKQ